MRVYLSFLLIIVFIACGGGGGIPSDKFERDYYITYNQGDKFTAKKGDSIILKTSNSQISVTRNMTSEESNVAVIAGSIFVLPAR